MVKWCISWHLAYSLLLWSNMILCAWARDNSAWQKGHAKACLQVWNQIPPAKFKNNNTRPKPFEKKNNLNVLKHSSTIIWLMLQFSSVRVAQYCATTLIKQCTSHNQPADHQATDGQWPKTNNDRHWKAGMLQIDGVELETYPPLKLATRSMELI